MTLTGRVLTCGGKCVSCEDAEPTQVAVGKRSIHCGFCDRCAANAQSNTYVPWPSHFDERNDGDA